MTETRFQEILQHKELLLESESELDKWIQRYPYVSIFQTLKAKALHTREDLDYDKQLKKAAISSPNRAMLYQYLIQPQIHQSIKKINDLESGEENISSLSSYSNQKDSTSNQMQEETSVDHTAKEDTNCEKTISQKENEDLQTLEKQFLTEAISASIQQEAVAKDKPVEQTEAIEVKTEKEVQPDFDESTSLLDWLKATGSTDKIGDKETTAPSKLIDTFILKDPQKISLEKENAPEMISIERPKKEFFSPENLARLSIVESEQFVTETLASIYARQGHTKKAISAYEKLGLKYPEKRDYFAALIKELKNKH